MEIDNLSDIFGDFEFNEDNEFFMDDQGDIEENIEMLYDEQETVDYKDETTDSLDELTSRYFPSDENLTLESYVIEHHKSLNSLRDGNGLYNENEIFHRRPRKSHRKFTSEKNQDKNEMLSILSSNKSFKSFDKLTHAPRKFKPIIFDLTPENVHNVKTKRDMSRIGKDHVLPKFKPIVFDLPQETFQNGETTENNDSLMSCASFESQSTKRRKNNNSVMSRLTFLNGCDVMSRVSFIGTGDVMSRISYAGKDTELSNSNVMARISFVNNDSESLSDINRVTSHLNFLNLGKEKCPTKISTKASHFKVAKNDSILWATQDDSYIDDLYNEDETSDGEVDRLSTTLLLQTLTIGNFINHYPCAISLNPTTQSICFTNLTANTSTSGDTSRLEIHIKGFEHYSRNDKLIELLLASKVSKWLIPVRTILNDNEIHLSIDPSEGEIAKAGKISMIVSDQENSDKLKAMDNAFRKLQIEATDPLDITMVSYDKMLIPTLINYEKFRFHYDLPYVTTLNNLLEILRKRLNSKIISPPLYYTSDSKRTFVIENEENWEECKKMVAKERHECENIMGNETILDLYVTNNNMENSIEM
ncbi:12406_t:CDS:2 [Dentiscutata erythropus]|uniref:12406_t:CDS:1 n=1 Tax=Dentiscutata erythropus TaxID=1348616 RepID=A0A9N9F831_9GLOM|nr:12406_t:CDS:2 [Dentiscutata erythropus]